MFNWKDKRVLVTGSEGMIGKELCEQLEVLGADIWRFDIKLNSDVVMDITDKSAVEIAVSNKIDYVFHLFGIKGNPKKTNERPADFMIPMLQGDTNIIEACQKYGVKQMLYTSSIAVENPETDFYPAWAKQTAEHLIDAMRTQYPKGTNYCIVRPANVFGRYDNFDNPDAMVITSLIAKAKRGEDLVIWGDGEFERDFISAKEVARGMIKVMENIDWCQKPVALSSGLGTKIKEVVALITGYMNVKATHDYTKQAMGSQSKIMQPDYKLHKKIGFTIPPGSFVTELKEVCNYVRNNK